MSVGVLGVRFRGCMVELAAGTLVGDGDTVPAVMDPSALDPQGWSDGAGGVVVPDGQAGAYQVSWWGTLDIPRGAAAATWHVNVQSSLGDSPIGPRVVVPAGSGSESYPIAYAMVKDLDAGVAIAWIISCNSTGADVGAQAIVNELHASFVRVGTRRSY